jgi:hypothetical protein
MCCPRKPLHVCHADKGGLPCRGHEKLLVGILGRLPYQAESMIYVPEKSVISDRWNAFKKILHWFKVNRVVSLAP